MSKIIIRRDRQNRLQLHASVWNWPRQCISMLTSVFVVGCEQKFIVIDPKNSLTVEVSMETTIFFEDQYQPNHIFDGFLAW